MYVKSQEFPQMKYIHLPFNHLLKKLSSSCSELIMSCSFKTNQALLRTQPDGRCMPGMIYSDTGL